MENRRWAAAGKVLLRVVMLVTGLFFLTLGILLDLLIWLIRWRPYWVWFRKERVIVNDDRFFNDADIDRAGDWEGDLASNWDEHDYVVASTVVKRQGSRKPGGQTPGTKRKASADRNGATPRRRSEGTKVKRHTGDSARPAADRQTGKTTDSQSGDAHRPEIFATELKKRDVTDRYEDEVFNVNNLPVFDEFNNRQSHRKTRRRQR